MIRRKAKIVRQRCRQKNRNKLEVLHEETKELGMELKVKMIDTKVR